MGKGVGVENYKLYSLRQSKNLFALHSKIKIEDKSEI